MGMETEMKVYLDTLSTERLENMLLFNAGLPRERQMEDEVLLYICALLAARRKG